MEGFSLSGIDSDCHLNRDVSDLKDKADFNSRRDDRSGESDRVRIMGHEETDRIELELE